MAMSEEPNEQELDERLRELQRQRQVREQAVRTANQAMGIGFRIGLELVVGVAVGAALGWALDEKLGTRPWIMVAGFVIGFGAGLRNVFRAVDKYDRKLSEAEAADKAEAENRGRKE
jgi:ATP synthase protein I